jgi:division protein CdvB (Snf7/Vps24/ESCRT-III family)
MNRQMGLPAMQIIMEFEKKSEIMDLKEGMMNDVIDGIMAEENDKEESDEIMSQVLDEINIRLNQLVCYIILADLFS